MKISARWTSYILGGLYLCSFLSCSVVPKHLSGKIETIDVYYVNYACDCPNFIRVTNFDISNLDSVDAENHLYITPAAADLFLPGDYYAEDHFNYILRLTGQFYTDKGVPKTYYPNTNEKPESGFVFLYSDYQLIPIPQPKEPPYDSIILNKLHGAWISETDSAAYISITDSIWTFGYKGEKNYHDDNYTISVTDTLTQFVKSGQENYFIVLDNAKTKTYFEILTLNDTTFSYFVYPQLHVQVYRKSN